MSRTITIPEVVAGKGNNKIQVAFNNCASFTDCISKIKNTQVDNTKNIYNLIGYSDNYLKTSGSLWQCYRDEPALNNASVLDNFLGNSTLFKYKQKITDSTENDGTKAVKIMVPLKYLTNFWRTLKVSLIK